MLKNETMDRREAGDLAGRLKHIGTSLAPLALFVAGALGYEQVTLLREPALSKAARPATGSAVVAVSSGAATLQAEAGTPVAPQAETAKPVVGSIRQPSPAEASEILGRLRDERSLLDLVETPPLTKPEAPPSPEPVRERGEARIQSESIAATGVVKPETAAAPKEVNIVERRITFNLGSAQTLALGLQQVSSEPSGGYAIVRGLPANARLTHGIAVGDESWLIDGPEIEMAGVDMREAAPGRLELDVAVLSPSSAILRRELVSVDIKAAAAAEVATVPVVAALANALPPPEPATVERIPALAEPSAPKPVVDRAPAATAALSMQISPETQLLPGRGGLLKLAIQPADAVPAGAHVVVRGLPQDTAMSRGMAMGLEAWLVGLSDIADLEVRLPARFSGAIRLEAKLVTAAGELLAQDVLDMDVRGPTAMPVASGTVVAALPSPIVTRSVPVPTTVPSPTPVERPADRPQSSGDLALARGRRMLALGNIAVARPFLERAANEGSGVAAALLAASFDPVWLRKAGVLGLEGDADKARHWYGEAGRLGVTDVERIVALSKPR